MGVVLGQDVVLQFTDDSFPFACARSISINIVRDTIEISVPFSDNFRSYISGPISYSGTIEGLSVVNYGSTSDFTIENLYSYIINPSQAFFTLKWYEEDVDHQHFLRKTGTVILTSLTETASFDNVVTFNAEFKGSGHITIENGTV